jgi:hypothetical protein
MEGETGSVARLNHHSKTAVISALRDTSLCTLSARIVVNETFRQTQKSIVRGRESLSSFQPDERSNAHSASDRVDSPLARNFLS